MFYDDDTYRNSISVTYEKEVNFDGMTKFSLILNSDIIHSEIANYMGYDMLIMERQENGEYLYTYTFNCDGKSVNITLTFTNTDFDVHDDIFQSIKIYGGE